MTNQTPWRKIEDGDNYKVKAEIVHLEDKLKVVPVTEARDQVDYDLAQEKEKSSEYDH